MKSPKIWYWLTVAALLVSAQAQAQAQAQAVESLRLTDVIKSNGTGNIDLFKDLTAAALETLRQDHGGILVLGVDVNEAASGTEKASSQGIAVEQLLLTVATESGVWQTTEFSTQTQSLLAPVGVTDRSVYYTLIGDTGSNRITSSNTIQDSFDATISIPVSIDLSTATSAIVDVVLVDTNVSLGDPEAFYDYSNGFEDMAVLNYEDAAYIDNLAAGRTEAPVVITADTPEDVQTDPEVAAWIFYPSSTTRYIVVYEDNFPGLGDYDFNDLSVAYQMMLGIDAQGDVLAVRCEAQLLTRGADYSHDWRMHLPLAGGIGGQLSRYFAATPADPLGLVDAVSSDGTVDVALFENSRPLFSAPGQRFVNTETEFAIVDGPRAAFQLDLTAAVTLNELPVAPFDPYIFVRNTNYEIHRVGEAAVLPASHNEGEGLTAFSDPAGFPYAMIVPDSFRSPIEHISVLDAYPAFADFIQSGGLSSVTWYDTPDVAEVMPMDLSSLGQ